MIGQAEEPTPVAKRVPERHVCRCGREPVPKHNLCHRCLSKFARGLQYIEEHKPLVRTRREKQHSAPLPYSIHIDYCLPIIPSNPMKKDRNRRKK